MIPERVDAFLAWFNRFFGRGALLRLNNYSRISYANTLKSILLDAVFHAASNERIFKPLKR
jgi:hypothetical protein